MQRLMSRQMLRLQLRLALLALLLAVAAAGDGLPSVAICVAIKDQAVDVREWIYYHRAVGACAAAVALIPALAAAAPPYSTHPCGSLLGDDALPGCTAGPAGVEKFYIWDTGSKPPLLVGLRC